MLWGRGSGFGNDAITGGNSTHFQDGGDIVYLINNGLDDRRAPIVERSDSARLVASVVCWGLWARHGVVEQFERREQRKAAQPARIVLSPKSNLGTPATAERRRV